MYKYVFIFEYPGRIKGFMEHNNCWSWTLAYAPNQIDTHVEFINQSEAHAWSTITWDPTVPIALNAVFQQSRWRMIQYAGERGTISPAAGQERFRNSLFPMNKWTPNTTKPPNQPFLFLWQLEVLRKSGDSADAVDIAAAQTAAELYWALYVRVDVDLRGLCGSQFCPTESYGPLDRSYNQYTPHHPPDPSLTYMSDSPYSVFHLSSWSVCWQVTIGSCFGLFHHMFF